MDMQDAQDQLNKIIQSFTGQSILSILSIHV